MSLLGQHPHRTSDNRRQAFTLVELMVVIAIVGLLVALLLPAVQSSREAGRQAQCKNHLKQLLLACHSYENDNSTLPPGWDDRGLGWSGFLLPYLEEQNLFDQINLVPQPKSYYAHGIGIVEQLVVPKWTTDANTKVLTAVVPVFRCPSSDQALAATNDFTSKIPRRAQSEYGGCVGSNVSSDNQQGVLTPFRRGIRVNGNSHATGGNNGVFFSRSVRLAEILDGTSKTIALGERRPDLGYDIGASGNALDHWAIGSPQVADGDEFSEFVGTTHVPINAYLNARSSVRTIEISFGSWHPHGAHFAYADGSVQLMTNDIGLTIYAAMGSRNGEEKQETTAEIGS